MGGIATGALRALLVGCAVSAIAAGANAETFVEHSAEARMQLDFVVPDAALRKFLPAGFETNVATQGAAKDCNVRMIFIDRVDITKQDGSPAGSNQLVYLAVPVKQTATNTVAQMLIYGLTADAKDAPGAHGVYAHADRYRVERSTKGGAGSPLMSEEHWEFAAASGESMEVHLTYERGVARKGSNETKFFSSVNPGFYQT